MIFNRIVASVFSQLFNRLYERANNKFGGNLHYVRILWDGAASKGQVLSETIYGKLHCILLKIFIDKWQIML